MALPFAHAARFASHRSDSQDRGAVFERGLDLVVAVADGAGGIRGGAAAADAFIDAVRTRIAAADFQPHDLRPWLDIFRNVDAGLAARATGESTAVVVVVGPQGLVGASVGDSEAWIVSPLQIDRLTEKQDRARLGSGRAIAVPFHRPTLGGALVVATDGLFRHARSDAIASACGDAAGASLAERLVALPRSTNGAYADDVAVVVIAAGR